MEGKLTSQKLVEASDEELMKMLTDIRGIGPWTVHVGAAIPFYLTYPLTSA